MIQFDVVRQELDIRCQLFAFIDTVSGREGNDSGTGNPRRGVRLKIQSHTQPCLELEERQGRRGGKDHDV